MIGLNGEAFQHLIEQRAMLRGDADTGFKLGKLFEMQDNRTQLNGFGASAEDDQDSYYSEGAQTYFPSLLMYAALVPR